MAPPSRPALLAAALFLAASIAMAEPASLRKRSFELSYTARVEEIPQGAKKVEVWVPYPQSDEHQRVWEGEPLNYFVYPYVEVDGKPHKSMTKKFAYRSFDTDTAGSR